MRQERAEDRLRAAVRRGRQGRRVHVRRGLRDHRDHRDHRVRQGLRDHRDHRVRDPQVHDHLDHLDPQVQRVRRVLQDLLAGELRERRGHRDDRDRRVHLGLRDRPAYPDRRGRRVPRGALERRLAVVRRDVLGRVRACHLVGYRAVRGRVPENLPAEFRDAPEAGPVGDQAGVPLAAVVLVHARSGAEECLRTSLLLFPSCVPAQAP